MENEKKRRERNNTKNAAQVKITGKKKVNK